MDFTLGQLLTFVGRLDDSLGFDTPRERFRRFLREQMATMESARTVIEQCRTQSGEQSHRAVQDAVVWKEYLETVVKERDGWKDLYRACKEHL